MSEALMDSETGIPLPFFPLVLAFGWSSVVNGILAEDTKFEFRQGETVLFRAVSAGVEPTIRLYFNESNAPDFLIVSEDGFPVPALKSTDVVPLPPGSRAEFMVKFDVLGTFQLRRKAWNGHSGEMHGMEACNADHASHEVPSEKCVSYDVDKLIATITVQAAFPPLDSQLPTDVPEYHPVFKSMEEMPVTKRRQIRMQVKVGFPIFQIPYAGPFEPPGTGFGINERLVTPHYRHGKIINGTCEEWTIISDPPNMEHSFHIHTNPFLVTHEDGVPVSEPFWRDAHAIYGDNITIKTCFNRLQPGDYVLVHCHQMSHVGVGVRTMP
jgi:FtsP/CotA-like multicopper oxidase with cupredoxin domain